MVNLRAGKWRGKSGAIYNVMDDLYSNSCWPFHDDAPLQENKRFWKADGTAWTGYVGGGDDLVAEVHAFKVGDRVRLTDDNGGYGEKGAEGVILSGSDEDWLVRFDSYFDGDNEWYVGDNIELVKPLTIEAGKFYMTRDGRRVGEAYRYDNGWCMRSEGGCMWKDNGERYFGNHEETWIISEAPAITATAAAEVDNLADEYGGRKKAAASEPKFKVGDRVRANTSSYGGAYVKDSVYEVTYINKDRLRAVNSRGVMDGWATKFFDHVTPSTAIVAVIEDGQPKPATRPYVHADRAAAKAEAERLAGVNKGKTFGVYELVDEAKVERVYEHEWQRLAAGGETVDARKTLQRTGLTGMQASRVVQEFVAAA